MAKPPKFIPAIRTLQEARDTLAEVLALPERRVQIITIMQKIVICRTPDTRKFMSDAMAGLIESGLEYMRKKRREAIEAMQKKRAEEARRRGEEEARRRAEDEAARRQREELEARIRAAMEAKRKAEAARAAAQYESMEIVEEARPEPEPAPPPPPPPPEPVPVAVETSAVLPSAEELKEIEELGTELDALSLAAVAREIYPDLKTQYEPWEVARAIYMDEAAAREAVLQGARLRDHERATMLAPALDNMRRLIENRRPWWSESLPAIRECIEAHFSQSPPGENGATAQHVFEVIAMSDDRAVKVLELIRKDNQPGVEYAGDVRRKLDKLMVIDEKRAN